MLSKVTVPPSATVTVAGPNAKSRISTVAVAGAPPAASGATVGTAVGVGVGVAAGAGVDGAAPDPTTSTSPRISGWMAHRNAKVPAVAKRCRNVSPEPMTSLPKEPSAPVTVCSRSSWFVHVTVPPTATRIDDGRKTRSPIVAATEVDAAPPPPPAEPPPVEPLEPPEPAPVSPPAVTMIRPWYAVTSRSRSST